MKENDIAGSQGSVPFKVAGAAASGSLLQPLNSSMIAVAIVGIGAGFGVSAGVSWVISAMYIANAVCAPIAGRLGAMIGARRVFLTGLALVCVGSLLGMFAPNLGCLIGAYVVLGTGISAHMPTAMTMIRGYAGRYDRQPRTAITTLVVCGQSVAALGPAVGGVLVSAFGWQSILWVNLPIAALSAAAILRADVGFAGATSAPARTVLRGLDIAGILLFLVTITSAMLFLVSLRTAPHWWVLPIVAAGLGAFIVRERGADEPFLDLRALFRNGSLSLALGQTLLIYTCIFGIFFGFPQWLQHSREMTPAQAGLTMLPIAGFSVVATVVGSRVYRRCGARTALLAGALSLALGGLSMVAIERSTAPILVVLVAAVLGIPNGFTNIGYQSLINEVTAPEDVGTAIGLYRTAAYIGANLSVVVLQFTAAGPIDDAGLHRTGWFVVASGATVLMGITFSRRFGGRMRGG